MKIKIIFLALAVTFLCCSATPVINLGVNKNMKTELFMPEGNGPFPAVIILHTSSGVTKYEIGRQ